MKASKKKSGLRVKMKKDLEDMPLEEPPIEISAPKSSKGKKGVIQKHREEIESLKEKDPEFFSFLAENDAQALGFGEEDEDDYSDEEDVGGENLDLDADGVDGNEPEFHAEMGRGNVEITLDLLKNVINKSVNGHYESIRKLIKMFKSACIPAADNDDEEGADAANGGFLIPTSDMYNEIMVQVLRNANVAFRAVVGLSANADLVSSNVKSHPKWKKVQLLVLSFFKSILHLLNKFSISQQDDQIVAYLIENMEPYTCFLFSMPRLAKATLKSLLGIWCQDIPLDQQHANSRGHAFLRIMQMAKTLPGSMLEECFRSMYLTFSRNSKSFTEVTSGTVLFMSESIAALFSIDNAVAYQQAFLYIRQLALHLRAALAKKTADAVKLVSSWQYLNCIRLWTKVICTLPQKTQLGELAFPLIQIIMGVITCSSSPYLFPLRFHLVTCLHQLSASCQAFVPTSSILLEVLDCQDLFTKPTPSTELAPNLRYLVKLPTDSLNRTNVKDVVVAEVISLISHDAELCRYNAGFPEYAIVTIKKLRAFSKKVKNSKWRDLSRALVGQLEEFSSTIKKERVRAAMSGSLTPQFEHLLPPNAAPVAQRLSKLLSSRIANAISLNASSVKLDASAGRKRKVSFNSKARDEADSDEDVGFDLGDDSGSEEEEKVKTNKKAKADKKKKAKKAKESTSASASAPIDHLYDTVDKLAWSDSDNDS